MVISVALFGFVYESFAEMAKQDVERRLIEQSGGDGGEGNTSTGADTCRDRELARQLKEQGQRILELERENAALKQLTVVQQSED